MAKKRQTRGRLSQLARMSPKQILVILLVVLVGWGVARLSGHDVSPEALLQSLLGETPAEQPKAPGAQTSGKKTTAQVGDKLEGTVKRVVDGDTLLVEVDGQSRRVRLVGVDTPETVHPNKAVQFYGPEASAFTKKELTGKHVWLEYDVAPLDRYQRHLAYIWLESPSDGEAAIRRGMFNARLLLGGYAKVMTIQPNSRYADLFVRFQEEARRAKRGLWGK
ncbi:MAG: thermonuclease family protein [Fretibacterium sp.]|nr:thermonuclease family protein [Fretibacterium sp.]